MIDLKFDHVSKRYRIRQSDDSDTQNTLLRKLRALRGRKTDFWAVRDVDFEVRRGEALGIIGHNGAGKSTILKLLSNITTPTSGEITINGRLAALIEVGSGFHPELSGRENIYLNGSILGMTRREITKKLDGIIDFAGVREFIDTPVKRYSSGMYVRLGFSIAAHLDPDILLLDEVLAVGDAAFQAKCLDRIKELEKRGTTIVFISHDLGAVERLCDRVLLMKRGQVVKSGPAAEIVAAYQSDATLSSESVEVHKKGETNEIEIQTLSFCDDLGVSRPVFKTGEPLRARIAFNANETVKDAVFWLLLFTADGQIHCELTTELSGEQISVKPGSGVVEFRTKQLGLQPGIYFTSVHVKKRNARDVINYQYKSTMLRVDSDNLLQGNFYLPHSWSVTQSEDVDREYAGYENVVRS
ncbi:MAG TPA: ABC transporter ATP-binding protein [Pyrinomonadaceae bacterium]|nr:ABC transporter ATP-binding protein [Pyrinomonadaceae bacterium]